MKIKYKDEIDNIKEILKGKYKELQDILDSDLDKDIVYIDKLNDEIEDMEKEVKNLKKKLNEDNNVIQKSEYKDHQEYSECLNNDKCYNEICKYKHSNVWDPFKNKKECINCKSGKCNKIDKKYKHINEEDENYDNIHLEKEIDILDIGNNKKNSLNTEKPILCCKNDIEKMEIQANEYIELIKKDLDVLIKKDDIYLYNYINFKMNLNKISSKILLFKNNYIDYIKNME